MTALRRLFRPLALAVSLLGCSGMTEKPSQPCEQAVHSEQDLNKAFAQAKEKLAREGHEVRSLLWNDEEKFVRLTDYLVTELGCTPQSRQSLREAKSCENVNLEMYLSSAHYCGPGAVREAGSCCPRAYPGDCLNQVCYAHDLCYDTLLQSSSSGGLCLWSEQTKSCDDVFFSGYQDCVNDQECGFWCRVTNVIAASLTAIEAGYDTVSPSCLWNGEYSWCEQPDGGSEDGPEGGNGEDCFTANCSLPNCYFHDDLNGSTLDSCRWTTAGAWWQVANGELQITSLVSLVANNPQNCSGENYALEYRAKFAGSGYDGYYVKTIGFMIRAEEEGVSLNCRCTPSFCPPGGPVISLDQNQWNTFKVERRPAGYEFLINGSSRAIIECPENPQAIGFDTSATDFDLRIDYITVAGCD